MIPRHNILVVQRVDEAKTAHGIIIPGNGRDTTLAKFKVLAISKEVTDIPVGSTVLAEDMFESIEKGGKGQGLLNEKYIHVIL